MANDVANGDMECLARRYNETLISVTDHLPHLDDSHPIFSLDELLPNEFLISNEEVERPLNIVKTNNAARVQMRFLHGLYEILLVY